MLLTTFVAIASLEDPVNLVRDQAFIALGAMGLFLIEQGTVEEHLSWWNIGVNYVKLGEEVMIVDIMMPLISNK